MSEYVIGIDTGGTYTDAVLLDPVSRKVLASAKEPTNHHRLALSTGNALGKLLDSSGVAPGKIKRLALSTTLATNAVVENKGARVAVIVVGYVKHFRLPVIATIFIKGGHKITGEEEEPLDLDNLVDTINGLKNEIDAYAVCGAMSMVNPTHEKVARKAIEMIDPKPVFCSYTVSDHTGMRERAATAALHAKLMPLMQDYVAGIQAAAMKNGIKCPIVLIGGNGEQIALADSIERAASTIASGPACTAGFGAAQGVSHALVVDVGGTTTDIAMVQDGKTVLAEDGCQIGQWQTHVEAVDMFTGGIGGDSYVYLGKSGNVFLGPTRVIPLSMGKDFPDPAKWLGIGNDSKCLALVDDIVEPGDDPVLRELISSGPSTCTSIKKVTGLSGVPLEKHLERLSRKLLLLETGFTPTDALHVLGKVDIGDRERAETGAAILAAAAGMDTVAFCNKIVEMTVDKIENLIIDYIINHYWGKSLTGFINSRKDHSVLGVEFHLKIPILGIGAAAKYFLPQVAEKLGTSVDFPQYSEVGNGVGAALLGSNP